MWFTDRGNSHGSHTPNARDTEGSNPSQPKKEASREQGAVRPPARPLHMHAFFLYLAARGFMGRPGYDRAKAASAGGRRRHYLQTGPEGRKQQTGLAWT